MPVLYIWLNRRMHRSEEEGTGRTAFDHFRDRYAALITRLVGRRRLLIIAYLAFAVGIVVLIGPRLGREIFPHIPESQFHLRLRAPAGSRIESTEQITLKALDEFQRLAGPCNVAISIGYVGTYAPS